MSPSSVRVRVPGKINLQLSVEQRRPDGYHDLVTVFHAVDLVDEIVARPADRLEVRVIGEGAESVPVDQRNLAWRAAVLLAEQAERKPDACLEIAKRIPVAAGMAGGSADAAGALVACAELWGLPLDRSALLQLAPRLGADVAFALVGGTALGTGIGDQLMPVLTTGTFHWVLALSEHGISTADAYRELDRQRNAGIERGGGVPTELVLAALREGDPRHLAEALSNDLEAAATVLRPELVDTLETGHRLGALSGIVSGSGPTCAFLAVNADAAARIAGGLKRAGVCRAAQVVTGPAPGAGVVHVVG